MTDLFPEISGRKAVTVKPCLTPYFLTAFWPQGPWWKVFPEMYESPDSTAAKRDAAKLDDKGWRAVTFLRLPASVWEEGQ